MHVSKYSIPLKLEENKYLLINSRTGTFDLVDREVVELLRNPLNGDPSVLETLKTRGHLTELSPEEELHKIEEMYKKYTKLPKKHAHFIIITYNCNLMCPYCYLSDIQSKDKAWVNKTITDEYIDKIFEIISSMDSRPGRITLYGGEPLLVKNKPIVEKILREGGNRGYGFLVLTNGVSVRSFLDVLKGYSVILQVTIDGPQQIHDTRRVKKDGTGTFDEVVQGVDAALDAGLTMYLRTNLDKDNIHVLPQVVNFYREKDWLNHPHVSLHFSPVFEKSGAHYEPITSRKNIYDSVIVQAAQDPDISKFAFDLRGSDLFENIFSRGELGPPRFWYCDANHSTFIFDPFGDVYVCTEHVGEEHAKVGVYYPELVLNEQYNQWRERIVLTIPECRECKYALFCGGGCGYKALEKYGTLSKPMCYDYDEVFTSAVPHLYRAAREKNAQT